MMHHLARWIFICVSVLTSAHTFGQTLDEDPLAQTQALLKSPEQRAQVIQQTPAAQAADQQVNGVAGSPENAQAMYNLSASIFGNLSAENGGDPEKMAKQLEAFKKNPELLEEHMTPEQKNDLKKISTRVPASH